jgi:flavin-dependent dehydrogenase
MRQCEVLIVGGGPAGSSCAKRLIEAGLDVLVVDRAAFPRDKVCAGWITPAVVRALDLDLAAYAAAGHTLQPFSGFRTGLLGGRLTETNFDTVVSYGIRRCEFDTYLLRGSRAPVLEGTPLTSLSRDGDAWIANRAVRASVVVGAGGHFCPVARQLNPRVSPGAVIAAQEIEFPLAGDDPGCHVLGALPELVFWPDLRGYGWCVRKGDHVNVGAGRLGAADLLSAVQEFAADLARRGVLPNVPGKWKGHAYLLNSTSPRRLVAEGALLAGDAAGLALAPSGEGILSAVESGLLAADAILRARASRGYSRQGLAGYTRDIAARFGPRARESATVPALPPWVAGPAARVLFRSRWLTRRVLIEDWFLHRRRPDLVRAPVRPLDAPTTARALS